MKITSNIIGKLEKIKNGTSFDDSLVVITEVIQNSQRAKAKNLYISLKEDILTFEDDGCGCNKPENILKLDYSEWESTNEGFGIGLWSWLAVPNIESIEITSSNWIASMNIKDLFSSENPKADMREGERIKGFKVSIKSPFFLDKYSPKIIEDRVKSDLETQLLNGYFNGEIVEKIDLHGDVGGVFNKYFSTNFFKATLAVGRFESPTLYYENRKVKKLYNIDSLAGVVEMRPKALMLKEPDRKSYVWDDKAISFEERLREVQKELYIDFIKQANREDIDSYADTIDKILNVSDYERFVFVDEEESEIKVEKRNLNFLETSKAHSINRLNRVLEGRSLNNELSFADGQLTEEAVLQIESLLNEASNKEDEKWVLDDSSTFTDGEMELSEDMLDNSKELIIGKRKYIKVNIENSLNSFEIDDEEILTKNILSLTHKPKKERKSLIHAIRNAPRKVWVKSSHTEDYKDLISKAEYYGVKVFQARNILEEKIFENNNISYISAIDTGIQKKNIFRDIELRTNKERYFIELLQPILKYYDLPFDTFKIGYLKLYVETTLDGTVINREIIENKKNKINIFGVTDGRSIILDRRAIGLNRFNLTEGNIGINEIKALMASLKTISHELAHLMYGTEDNTKYHFKMEDIIYDEIVNLYLTL